MGFGGLGHSRQGIHLEKKKMAAYRGRDCTVNCRRSYNRDLAPCLC